MIGKYSSFPPFEQNRMFVGVCVQGPGGGRGLIWRLLRAPWDHDPPMLHVNMCRGDWGLFRGEGTEPSVTYKEIRTTK